MEKPKGLRPLIVRQFIFNSFFLAFSQIRKLFLSLNMKTGKIGKSDIEFLLNLPYQS